MDYELTRRVLAAFEREVAQYAVFGGVALNLQALARHARRAGKTEAPAPPPEPEPKAGSPPTP